MLIKISSVDDILPSLEALSELGISYKTNDDNSIIIELNTPDFKVAENKDMPILLSSNCPNADSSLLYFVINFNISNDYFKLLLISFLLFPFSAFL